MSMQPLGLAVKRVQMKNHRAVNAGLLPLGVTIVQWDALRHLRLHPEASLHDLAQLTFQTDQAFGTLAARMTSRGLIERTDGRGRAVRHRLTPKGEELYARGADVVERALEATFAPLGVADRAHLERIFSSLL